MGGTYTLLLELSASKTVRFGALGERALEHGWYGYVGSAFGPGGFERIERPRRVAAGSNHTRRWHIDYLLGLEATRIERAVRSPDVRAECRIARSIDGIAVDGVGASDCGCDSHLVYSPDGPSLEGSIETVHAAHS